MHLYIYKRSQLGKIIRFVRIGLNVFVSLVIGKSSVGMVKVDCNSISVDEIKTFN